jgi:hypothetical protein
VRCLRTNACKSICFETPHVHSHGRETVRV